MARPFKPAPGIGERLLELRGEKTREEFAEIVGMHHSSVGNYERGDRKIDVDTLILLHERTGADLNWLLTGEGSALTAGVQQAAGMVPIPHYEVSASAGNGAVVLSQDVTDYFSVSRDWLSRIAPPNANLGILEARGDSMSPTIRDGDVLVVNFDIDDYAVADGGVFVLSFDGMLVVKRVQITMEGQVLVISDNERYETERLDREYADEKMTVHAKVIWAGGALR